MEFITIHSIMISLNVSVFHCQRINKEQDLGNYKRSGFNTSGQLLLGLF